jgi:hypothetical protein
MSRRAIAFLAAYYVVIYGLLIVMQYALWESFAEKGKMTVYLLWLAPVTMEQSAWYICMVLSVGALGSFVHATTSLADFVGNREAIASWSLWFIVRPFVGSALALILYLILRGGLLSTAATDSAQGLNVYGLSAVAGLAGMFSRQATDKLGEVFDTLFRTEVDRERKDPLHDGAHSAG